MTLRASDRFRKYCCLYNHRLFALIGLWPYQKLSKRLLRVTFVIFILTISILSQIIIFLTMELKMDLIIELMQTFLPTSTFFLCYCNMIYNSTRLRTIFHRIRYDLNDLTEQQELTIMRKYANESKLLLMSIALVCYLYIVFLMIPFILYGLLYIFNVIDDMKLKLPLHVEYFLKSSMHYYIVLLYEFIAAIIICTVGVANYSMFISFTQHACALFNIVSIKLERPFQKSQYSFLYIYPLNTCEKEYDWIVDAIKWHCNAINFVALLKLMYIRIYFIEILLAMGFIIIDYLYLFEFLPLTKNIHNTLKRSIYISANLLIIYIYCYLGQKLINNSTGLLTKCCEIPFDALSIKTRKMLLLLMVASLKPSTFSMSGIIVASHEMFTKIMRSSLSFAMVCYKVRQ